MQSSFYNSLYLRPSIHTYMYVHRASTFPSCVLVSLLFSHTVSGLSSSSADQDKVVIAAVCTSISVVIIVVIMIVIFCVLYHKRQIICKQCSNMCEYVIHGTSTVHTYKINSIVELDNDGQEKNTYTMISIDDKPVPSNDDELPEIVRIYVVYIRSRVHSRLGEYQ